MHRLTAYQLITNSSEKGHRENIDSTFSHWIKTSNGSMERFDFVGQPSANYRKVKSKNQSIFKDGKN